MSAERISHMESCLQCGLTNSAAIESNNQFEVMAERFIGLAVRAGDVAALHELATYWTGKIGGFGHKTGSVCAGPDSLYKLRRIRIARKALEAAELLLEPLANDLHRFDGNGHKI